MGGHKNFVSKGWPLAGANHSQLDTDRITATRPKLMRKISELNSSVAMTRMFHSHAIWKDLNLHKSCGNGKACGINFGCVLIFSCFRKELFGFLDAALPRGYACFKAVWSGHLSFIFYLKQFAPVLRPLSMLFEQRILTTVGPTVKPSTPSAVPRFEKAQLVPVQAQVGTTR